MVSATRPPQPVVYPRLSGYRALARRWFVRLYLVTVLVSILGLAGILYPWLALALALPFECYVALMLTRMVRPR